MKMKRFDETLLYIVNCKHTQFEGDVHCSDQCSGVYHENGGDYHQPTELWTAESVASGRVRADPGVRRVGGAGVRCENGAD